MYSIFKKCTGINNLFDDLLNISIKGAAAVLNIILLVLIWHNRCTFWKMIFNGEQSIYPLITVRFPIAVYGA